MEIKDIQPLSYRLIRFIFITAVYFCGYLLVYFLKNEAIDLYQCSCIFTMLLLLNNNNFLDTDDILLKIITFYCTVALIFFVQYFLRFNFNDIIGFLVVYHISKYIDDREVKQ